MFLRTCFFGLMLIAIESPAPRVVIKGTVRDAENKPIAGATAYVHSARPRDGRKAFCPTCYPDCAKTGVSDANGNFEIASLDPALYFRIFVVADGYLPQTIDKIDPLKDTVEATLQPIPAERLAEEHVLRGSVVDPAGKPVAAALVTPTQMVKSNLDPLAITNPNGEFILTGDMMGGQCVLEVNARGFATTFFRDAIAGQPSREYRLNEGATVKGKVMKDGNPLPGVTLGLFQADHGAEFFWGARQAVTDAAGDFIIYNVPVGGDQNVFGMMADLKPHGALPAKTLKFEREGEVVDAGVLHVVPGHRLRGEIRLADGNPVPAGTEISLSREAAWDSQYATVDAQGRFEFENLPTEPYRLSVKLPGYSASLKNKSVDLYSQNLVGTVSHDIDGLVVLLEPDDGSAGALSIPKNPLQTMDFKGDRSKVIEYIQSPQYQADFAEYSRKLQEIEAGRPAQAELAGAEAEP